MAASCHLNVFLFKVPIHIGVVTICSVGITLMATSLWINLVSPDPEIKKWTRGGNYWTVCYLSGSGNVARAHCSWFVLRMTVHWTIVSLFDVSGLGVYILGMVTSYFESSRLATILLAALILHSLVWIALTTLSFGNWVLVNSWVNGEQHNMNSQLVNLFTCTLKQNSVPYAAHIHHVVAAFKWEQLDDSLPPELHRIVCIDNRCADLLFMKNGNWRISFDGDCNNPSLERWNGRAGYFQAMDYGQKRTIMDDQLGTLLDNRRRHVDWTSTYNRSLIHTPIGYIGCNAVAHIVYSAICAALILGFWYIYPIIIVKSYVDTLKRRQVEIENL